MVDELQARLIAGLIEAAAQTIADHADRLTALDQAVGDGDHGLNMRRGFAAVAEAKDKIAAEPLGRALQSAGTMLVMKVGGASGPLYGSLLLAMGKNVGDTPPTIDAVRAMIEAGVEAVKARGRSAAGEKTMLDVLVPVAETLGREAARGAPAAELLQAVRQAADDGLARTRDMKATKGRASFLGDRSIGHLDPGARSSCLLVHAVCNVLEGQS